MRKSITNKVVSLVLACSMVLGTATGISGCGSKKKEVITLDVFSQLANYSGLQTGWMGDILKKKYYSRPARHASDAYGTGESGGYHYLGK